MLYRGDISRNLSWLVSGARGGRTAQEAIDLKHVWIPDFLKRKWHKMQGNPSTTRLSRNAIWNRNQDVFDWWWPLECASSCMLWSMLSSPLWTSWETRIFVSDWLWVRLHMIHFYSSAFGSFLLISLWLMSRNEAIILLQSATPAVYPEALKRYERFAKMPFEVWSVLTLVYRASAVYSVMTRRVVASIPPSSAQDHLWSELYMPRS
jgi:hypothetical protein